MFNTPSIHSSITAEHLIYHVKNHNFKITQNPQMIYFQENLNIIENQKSINSSNVQCLTFIF